MVHVFLKAIPRISFKMGQQTPKPDIQYFLLPVWSVPYSRGHLFSHNALK